MIGKTETLKYFEQIEKLTHIERMMRSIDKFQTTIRARCFILGILQEKSKKVKKTIINNLEFLAEEAERLKHQSAEQSQQENTARELNEICSMILSGIVYRIEQQAGLEMRTNLTDN